nr:DUF2523 domain-containing protein [uncultured Roseateles sp.]
MPLFIAALLGGLVSAAGTLVGKVLISLGIGYVVYTGVDFSLEWIKLMINASFAGLPPQTMQIMSTLKLGSFAAVLFSALAARLVLDGLTGGSIKRMVQK